MRSLLLLTIVLVLFIPFNANAEWINNGTAISLAVGPQLNPVAASDGAGGAIIAWLDQRTGASDIYAQRVDASGVPKWGNDGVVICTATGNQSPPAIVADGSGGAIITWYDPRSGVNLDIYVQRINSAGTVLWTANGVALCTALFDQINPVVVSDGAAGAIVAWIDFRSGVSYDVYARRINSTGVPQWAADGIALCNAPNTQAAVAIASDGAGGAIATWEDNRGANTDIYAQRINGTGTPMWAANGVAVCAANNGQGSPWISADGASGAVVAWQDMRTGQNDIYAQRVNANGLPLWLLDGVAVCTDAATQYEPVIAWDNTTGAIVCWYDYRSGQGDIYARRITPSGSPVWTYDGTPVCTASGGQVEPRIVSDGAGGAVMAWGDNRTVYGDVYAQRIDAAGLVKWGNDGMPVSLADLGQYTPAALVGDGSGGAVIAWYDGRSGPGTYDIYAQRVDGRFGYWGKPEPSLFAVKDVPADQGGKVRLEWYASQRDQIDQQTIYRYTIWRAIDQAAFASASAAGVPELKLTDPASKFTGKAIRRDKAQATDYFWELIGQQDATYRYAYSFNASTSFDSTASNAATHRFQIVAHSFGQFVNWPSNVLTGRSVDNVAPPAPLFLTAQRIGNYVHLKWNGVHLPDLNKYTVYRKTSTGVTAIPANFLADDSDTLLTDTTAPPSSLYYIVTATDVHQNQGAKSNEAAVLPATGVGNLPPITALTVLQNHPNPFTGETQINVGLPAGGDVRVEIYDVAGRRVRNVLVPTQEKGWDTLRISARDDRGALLPSGVYFYRVHAGNQTVTKKMVIAR